MVLSGSSDRAFATHRGAVAVAGLSDADIERAREVGARGGHVHIAGYYNMPAVRARVGELFRAVREAGGSSSLNPQWDADERWEGICELSVAAGTAPDVLICSYSEMLQLATWDVATRLHGITITEGPRLGSDQSGQQGVRQLLDAGRARCVAVTHGEDAACALSCDDERVARAVPPTLEPDALVDATGAGDAFAAGFLTKFAVRDPSIDLDDALKTGCAYGAACCGVVGASAALDPSRVAAYEAENDQELANPIMLSARRPRRPPSQ